MEQAAGTHSGAHLSSACGFPVPTATHFLRLAPNRLSHTLVTYTPLKLSRKLVFHLALVFLDNWLIEVACVCIGNPIQNSVAYHFLKYRPQEKQLW